MPRYRRYQHGCLFKRGKRNRVWVGRWWEPALGPDGRFQRIRRSEVIGKVAEIPTRRDAERLLNQRIHHMNCGDYQAQSNCTFATFVNEIWLPSVKPTLKFSTQRHYEYAVNVHLLPAFGDLQLRSISRDNVQKFIFTKSAKLSWKTVKHLRTILGTIMTAAEIRDLIAENPVRKTRLLRRMHREERPEIAPEKIRQLLANLPEPSRSLAALLVFTGLRIGELLALRWRDLDLKNGLLRVEQTVYEGHFDDPKTRSSRRTIPLGPDAVAIFERRRPEKVAPDALVFSTRRGTPLSRRNLLRRQLAPTAERLGIPGVNWHWLRHANATLHDSSGTPLGTLQVLLGHSSSEITRMTYVHAIPADARQAVEKVEKLIGPKWTQVLEFQKSVTTLIQ